MASLADSQQQGKATDYHIPEVLLEADSPSQYHISKHLTLGAVSTKVQWDYIFLTITPITCIMFCGGFPSNSYGKNTFDTDYLIWYKSKDLERIKAVY